MKTRQYRPIQSYTLDKAMKMKLRKKAVKVEKTENAPPPISKDQESHS